jgi:hypothetical protein
LRLLPLDQLHAVHRPVCLAQQVRGVVAEAGDGVGVADAGAQPAGDCGKNLVADGVAVAVVDPCEAVEIGDQQRDAATVGFLERDQVADVSRPQRDDRCERQPEPLRGRRSEQLRGRGAPPDDAAR